MNLAALVDQLDLHAAAGPDPRGVEVTDVTDDSRRAAPGALLIVRAGGEPYVADALARGAVAVVAAAEPPAALGPRVTWLRCSPAAAADQALTAELASRFFGHPTRGLKLVGITGTKGKTTTAIITQHLLAAAGLKTGLIGTIRIDVGAPEGPRPAELTTPGAVELMRLFRQMADHGCRAAVFEVSSHALHQRRVAALRFDAAVFTNLTGDHLDYHGTMEAYADAKALIFAQLAPAGFAVVNLDDAWAGRMLAAVPAGARVMGCTLDAGEGVKRVPGSGFRVQGEEMAAETARRSAGHNTPHPEPHTLSPLPIRATVLRLAADHALARFDGPWGDVEVKLPLVGRHNVINALQAAAAAAAVAPVARTIAAALASTPPVPGRLEPVRLATGSGCRAPASAEVEGADNKLALRTPEPEPRNPSPALPLPTILVDYAHTHDALEKVLEALRPLTPPPGRLIVLFGCGGDRDKTKRPKMAAVAARLADVVVITSDNPRTEDPDAIIRDIVAGLGGGHGSWGARRAEAETCSSPARPPTPDPRPVLIDPDRAAAIVTAIDLAEPGDTVLLAGKGHEDYQIIGKTKRHFDDREHAAAALRGWAQKRGHDAL